MKNTILIIITCLALTARAAFPPPLQSGPGTTNTPANWTNVVQGAVAPSVMAAAPTFTNVISVRGQPMDVNMEQLWRFQNALIMSNTRPLRIVAITDLSQVTAFPGSSDFWGGFTGLMGRNGGLLPGGSGEGDFALNISGATAVTAPAAMYLRSTVSQPYYSIVSGNTVTWSRRSLAGAPGIVDTNVWADSFSLAYIRGSGAGTFKIQTNINGGGWNDCRTIDASVGSTLLSWTNITFTPGYYSVRTLGVSGTVTNIDASLFYSATNGLMSATLLINNNLPTDLTGASSIYSHPFWAGLNPDLIIYLDTSGAYTPNQYPALENIWTNNCPNADVIYVGSHFVSDAEEAVAGHSYWEANLQARTNAFRYNRGFFDVTGYLGTNITALVAAGMMNADLVHLQANGEKYMNSILFSKLMQPLYLFAGPTHAGAWFQGSEVNLFNNARTNALAIGTAPGLGRLDINAGNNSHFIFDSLGAQEPGLWLNGTKAANQWALNGDANSTVLNAPSGGANWGLIFKTGGNNMWRFWYSGGLDIGYGNTDPGTKNLTVRGGTIYVGDNDGSSYFSIQKGTGSPEGVVTSTVGGIYINLSGSTATTLYVKTSGSGNTGWTAK